MKKLAIPSAITIAFVVIIGVFILIRQGGVAQETTQEPDQQSEHIQQPQDKESNIIDRALETIGLKEFITGSSSSNATNEEASGPTGTVSGYIRNINAYSGMQVCAKNIISDKLVCTNLETASDLEGRYQLTVAPGQYYIYATIGFNDLIGLYNEQVSCTPGSTCTRDPIVVEVKEGDTLTNINPDDWGSTSTAP